jgi:hypothetical protein
MLAGWYQLSCDQCLYIRFANHHSIKLEIAGGVAINCVKMERFFSQNRLTIPSARSGGGWGLDMVDWEGFVRIEGETLGKILRLLICCYVYILDLVRYEKLQPTNR